MRLQSTEPHEQHQDQYTADLQPWRELAARLLVDAAKTARQSLPSEPEDRDKARVRRMEARQWLAKRGGEMLEFAAPSIDNTDEAIDAFLNKRSTRRKQKT